MKIDKITKKIIHELDNNARQTISAISTKIRLSKRGTDYRIRELERNHVIKSYYPIIDFFKLGFKYNRAIIKLKHLDTNAKERIEQVIKQDDNINWAVWLVGEYDLGITFWTKTDTEFKNALENLIVQIEDNFQDKYISKVIGLDQYNYPIEKYERTKISIKETKNIEQIDGLDIKILKQLNKNARLTSTQISRAIKSNYKIVAYRIKRLIEKKILIGARCDINYTLLGHHNSKIFIYLKHDAERTKQLISYIENLKQTIYIVNQIGSADLDIELIAENELEYDKIISQMIDTFSDIIITLKQMNFQKTIKISYLPKMD